MSEKQDEEIDRATLHEWSAVEPPADFADRVMAARAEGQRERPRPGRGLRAFLGAALLLGTAAMWLLAVRSGDGSGQASPAARVSLLVGRRAVAVAEPGSLLSWSVRSGKARVEQRAGEVFYRVEHGGAFVVSTPAGDVTVQGTCFRVEVDPMFSKQAMMAAGAGAVVATTILVTVYEGRVLLANEHGKTTLQAGEQASARAGSAPSAAVNAAMQQKSTPPTVASNLGPPAEGSSRDELLKRDAAQRAELEKLRARVHDLEAASTGGDKKKDERPFFDPSKEELQAMAKDCKLKWDNPQVGLQPPTIGPKQSAELGLSDQERAEANQVGAAENQRILGQLRALYIEVTGDKAGADSLTPQALENEIMSKSPEASVQQTFYRLSHERAGLQAPPPDATGQLPVERLMRLMTGFGDDYEQKLGTALGPDRARQLRSDNGGWGSRSQSSYGCPE